MYDARALWVLTAISIVIGVAIIVVGGMIFA